LRNVVRKNDPGEEMDAVTRPEVRRLTTAVGATIGGVDLARPVEGETLGVVRQALLDHGVVFFRDQTASVEQLWDFLRNFGTPQKDDSFGTDADRPKDVQAADFSRTRRGTAFWHVDSSFLEKPPKFTLLRMVRGPAFGGDTCWASTAAAYEGLSRPVRDMLDGLSAVHAITQAVSALGDYGDAFIAEFCKRHAPQQTHPVVQLHPETGRKALFVTESCTTRIVDLQPAESRHLLGMLFEHIKSPDFSLRWRWSANDVALWDNRSVQHYAVPDYTAERIVHRIVVAGERPFGP
jgi:taurine dioxygenase